MAESDIPLTLTGVREVNGLEKEKEKKKSCKSSSILCEAEWLLFGWMNDPLFKSEAHSYVIVCLMKCGHDSLYKWYLQWHSLFIMGPTVLIHLYSNSNDHASVHHKICDHNLTCIGMVV